MATHANSTPAPGRRVAPPGAIDVQDALNGIRRDLRGLELMAHGVGHILVERYLLEPIVHAAHRAGEDLDRVQTQIEALHGRASA